MVKMSYYAEYTDVVTDKHKVPGYRGVPPKNGAGLYRAGVAELTRHIIRMRMMSTKTYAPSRLKVGDGTLKARQVPHVGLWTIVLLLLLTLMLLLDLFIYLNFEQKQQEGPFVDIYNLHGKNITPVVLFKQKK